MGGPTRASFILALGLWGCTPPEQIGELESAATVCPKGATTNGVDVSHYQGTVDWATVHGAGIDFAIIKATEGTTVSDAMFATNWANAKSNGLVRGAYHFFHSDEDPVAQAQFFVQTAGVPEAGDLPLTIDLEVTDGNTGPDVAAAALMFVQEVQTLTSRTPIVYTSPSFYTSTLGDPSWLGAYTLWVANWQTTCPDVPSPP